VEVIIAALFTANLEPADVASFRVALRISLAMIVFDYFMIIKLIDFLVAS